MTYEQIAQKCGLAEDDTRRLLQHAVANHVFRESHNGAIAHNAISRVLAETPLVCAAVEQTCEDMWPSAMRMVDAMQKWPASGSPTQTGFNLAFKTTEPFFKEIAKSPERAQRFASAMSFFQSGPGFETSRIIDGFDWASLGSSLVIDIGGSKGVVGEALVAKYPAIHCVVQDLPEALGEASSSPEVSERLSFQPHDFFAEQPVRGADVYLLRMVLHDWSDEYCIKILRSLVPALQKSSRVIINDICIPDLGVLPPDKRRQIW